MLRQRHRHLPAGRPDLHPQLRLLPGGEGRGAQPRGWGRSRAGGRRGDRPGPALRGAHGRGPRRPPRPWRQPVYGHHGGDPPAQSPGCHRGAHPGFLGRPARRNQGRRGPTPTSGHRAGGRTGLLQPQPRNGATAPGGGAPGRHLRALVSPAGGSPGVGTPDRHQIGTDVGAGRNQGGSGRSPGGFARCWLSTPHPRAIPAAIPGPYPGGPLLEPRRV